MFTRALRSTAADASKDRFVVFAEATRGAGTKPGATTVGVEESGATFFWEVGADI